MHLPAIARRMTVNPTDMRHTLEEQCTSTTQGRGTYGYMMHLNALLDFKEIPDCTIPHQPAFADRLPCNSGKKN